MTPIENKKRRRIVVVCTNCKKRKKKCDKNHPCSLCKESSLTESCNYEYENNSGIPNYMINANKSLDLPRFEKIASISKTKEAQNIIRADGLDKRSLTDFASIGDQYKGNLSRGLSPFSVNTLETSTKNEDKIVSKNQNNREFIHEGPPTKSILLNNPDSIDLCCKMLSKSKYRSLVGINPFSISKEFIYFYNRSPFEYPMKDTEGHPTLSWTSLMLRDHALKTLWETAQLKAQEEERDIFYKVSSIVKNQSINNMEEFSCKEPLNSYDNDLDYILRVLPSVNKTWDLVEHFFLNVYPFMPFLDERYFKSQVLRILSSNKEDARFRKIHIFSGADYAYLGILLVVLKLSYLSSFSNASLKSIEVQANVSKLFEDFHKSEDPLRSSELIHCAKNCIKHSELLKADSFSVFLLAFFIKLYEKYAPEDEEIGEGNVTQRSNSHIIRRAVEMGINRIVSTNYSLSSDIDHLKCKIWCFLILSDLSQGYSYGYEAYITLTEPEKIARQLHSDNSNLNNKDRDKEITNFFFKCFKSIGLFTNLLSLVLNKNGCKISQLCEALSELERSLDDDMGSFDICMHFQQTSDILDNYKRLFVIKNHLSFDVFLINLFWHIFLHYEFLDSNNAYFYLKKAILLIFEVHPHCYDLLNKSRNICDFVINPSIAKFIHKANQILLSLLIRMEFIICSLTDENNAANDSFIMYSKHLVQLRDSLIENIRILSTSLSSLAGIYNNASHIIKTYDFFLGLISTPHNIKKISIDFYECKKNYFRFSYGQILEILEILQVPQDFNLQTIFENPHLDEISSNFDELAFNLQYDFEFGGSFFDNQL